MIGLISDTHGLLRPEAVAALRGASRIVHAGDVGDPEILSRLGRIAPVVAVRGNVDVAPGLSELPSTAELEIDGTWIHVLHILDDLGVDPGGAGFDVIVYGHSHQPTVERRRGVLYVNPGSAGPRRFNLPVTLARLTFGDDGPEVEIVPIVTT